MMSCSATAISSSSNFGSSLSAAFPVLVDLVGAGLLLVGLVSGAVTAAGVALLRTTGVALLTTTGVALLTTGLAATAFTAAVLTADGFAACFTTRAISTLSFPVPGWRGPVPRLQLPTAPPSPSPVPFRPRIARGLSHCAYPSCAPGGFCPQAQQPPRHQHSAAEPPTRV